MVSYGNNRRTVHGFDLHNVRLLGKSSAATTVVTINPNIMLGKPTIRNMRITVEQLLRALSGGLSEQELLKEYPELEKEDFQAVFAYATGLIEEEQVFPVGVSA